jgi:hypothetical protein
MEENTPVQEKIQSMKKETITVDKSVESVIQSDKEGVVLLFDSAPGKFLKLPDDVIRGLSERNKSSYFAALGAFTFEEQQKGLEPTKGFNINPYKAEAGARLEVKYPDGWLKKWHPCWKRTDELQACQTQGYVFVRGNGEDAGVVSYAFDESRGLHVVGIKGHEELYLMKVPVDAYKAIMSVSEERSRLNNGELERKFMEEAETLGGKPVSSTKEIAM